MKISMALALIFFASIVGAGTAAAQSTASFRFAGVQFEVPLAAGYCLPRGHQIDTAQMVAAADEQNVTHLTIYPCQPPEGPLTDYVLIKTPVAILAARPTREQLLQGLGEAFTNGPLSSGDLLSAEQLGQIENRLSSVTGNRVDLTGNVRPLGRDETCAYLGGTMQVSTPAASYSVSAGVCITVISNRVLSINWYGPDRGAAGIAALLVRARRLAESMRAAPAN